MQYSLIIFLIVVAISIYRGYRSGVAVIVSRILSLALAYVAAFLLTDTVAEWIQSVTPLKGLIAYFAAGSIIFIVVSLVVSSLFSLVTKTLFSSEKGVSAGSAIGGAVLGGTLGCVIGIIAVWFITTFYGLIQLKGDKPVTEATAFEKTARKITGKALEKIADQGLGDSELASGTVKLLSDPGETLKQYKQLSKSGALNQFFNSQQVRTALDNRSPAELLNTDEFKQLTSNENFKQLASQLDLSDDPEVTNQLLAAQITKVWAQISQLQDNEEYQQIINDPFIRQSLKSGNLFNLLNNEKLAKLFKVIAKTDVGKIEFTPIQVEEPVPPIGTGEVHRWVDEEGKVHYSDKKVPEDN